MRIFAVDLTLRDHVIDPIAEGIDIVVRMAELRESELVHKKIGTVRLPTVASPDSLRRRGRPSHPSDLRRHETIGFLAGGLPIPWPFRGGEQGISIPTNSRLNSNSIDAIRNATVGGLGLAQLLDVHVRDDVAEGRLEVVLADYESPPQSVHTLYAREKAALPKVRVCLEFLTECLRTGGERRARGREGHEPPFDVESASCQDVGVSRSVAREKAQDFCPTLALTLARSLLRGVASARGTTAK